ncbi:MAG: hypothetical protein KC492_17135, partial [Myxococcales bacterium]|nr:hypothetical protein [Myxococcales bacterium]
IQADFGGKAAELFSGVVATVGAAVDAPLHNSGPIRGSKERQLRIVGTAQGSFGFMLENPEPAQGELPGASSRIDPVEVTVSLLQEAADGNEEPFAEIVLKVPRVLTKLHSFVKHVTDRRATFAVEFGRHRAAIHSVEEGKAMLELLSGEVDDREQEVRLTIGGVFPSQRRFEAHLDGTVIHGDLGPDISADTVQATVGSEVGAKLHVRAFRQSKRYTLLALSR